MHTDTRLEPAPALLEPARSPLRGLSLRVLLLGSLVVVVLATLLLVSLSVLELMRETAERERRQAAAMLATAAAHTLVHSGREATDTLLAAWREDALVERYELVALEPGAARGWPAELADDPAQSPQTRIEQGDGHRVIVAAALVPGTNGERPRFVVVVGLSMARFDGQIASAQALVLLYGVLIGLATLVLGYLLVTRSVVRPVQRLVRAVERVGAGDLETHIAVGGVGEVAELSERFNTMVDAVRLARDETERGLHELEATNRELRDANRTIERARDELVRSERLANVGQLSAGIAHEIGNPLSSILAYLELLREEPAMPPDEALDLLARTEEATRRIHRIIRELLDYSRAEASAVALLSPRAAVEQALRLVAPQPRLRRCELADEVPRELPPVPLDESRLVQVLVNLVLNAADALAEHTPAQGARPRITLGGHLEEDALVLTVADNGPGIPPDALPHIFAPFFTTKAPGQGTGLGLAICERLVEQMGATLGVDTGPAGTIFSIRFRFAPSRSAGPV